jgi:hypothetical protein
MVGSYDSYDTFRINHPTRPSSTTYSVQIVTPAMSSVGIGARSLPIGAGSRDPAALVGPR